jgi:GT2 family glycosyltransferase
VSNSGPDFSLEDGDVDIAVTVVSHQNATTIDECLTRLRAARGVAEIHVIDNASSDGTLDIIQRHAARDPRLRFIGNPDNPGFAVACNQGAAQSRARWLAFVNPDLMVEADTLSRLRDYAMKFPLALLGVDLVNERGEHDQAARRHNPDFAAMLNSPRARKLAIPMESGLSLQPVDAISGALMLLPRELFGLLGGLDEGYRLHAEDLDLCRRARQLGAVVAVANNIRVLHLRGVSSRSRPWFVEWHKHRGLWRYYRKFDANNRRADVNAAVFCMIWSRFPFTVARAALKAVWWLKRP